MCGGVGRCRDICMSWTEEKVSRGTVEMADSARCQKCAHLFLTTVHNFMKNDILAFEKYGRKCSKKVAEMFVIQEKLLPLQSIC